MQLCTMVGGSLATNQHSSPMEKLPQGYDAAGVGGLRQVCLKAPRVIAPGKSAPKLAVEKLPQPARKGKEKLPHLPGPGNYAGTGAGTLGKNLPQAPPRHCK